MTSVILKASVAFAVLASISTAFAESVKGRIHIRIPITRSTTCAPSHRCLIRRKGPR